MSELLDLARDASSLGQALGAVGQMAGTAQGSLLGVATATVALTRAALDGAAAYERQAHAVDVLGRSWEAVRTATNNTVTAQEALRAQQTLMQTGLRVSSDELAAITRRAREYAHATGTETPQALDQLVDALKGGEAEGLRRFGIAVRRGETDVHLFHRALGEMGSEFRARAPEARTLAEEMELLGRNSTNLGGSLAALVTHALGLGGALRSVNDTLHDIAETGDHLARLDRRRATDEQNQDARDRLQRVAGSASTRLLRGRAIPLGNLNDFTAAQANELAARIERENREGGVRLSTGTDIFGPGADIGAPAGPPRATFRRLGADASDYDLGIAGLAARFRLENARGAHPAQTPERPGRVVGGGGGGGGGTNPLLQLKNQLTEAQREAASRGVPIYQVPADPGETLGQYWARLTAGQRDLNRLFPDMNRMDDVATAAGVRSPGDLTGMFRDLGNLGNGPTREQMRAGGAARGVQLDRDPSYVWGEARDRELHARGPNDMGAQLETGLRGFANSADRTQTVAQTMAGAVTDAFHDMTKAAVGFVDAIASGADPAEALRQGLHSLGEALMQKAGLRALEAGLEGSFRLATSYGADPTGWALLANAAAWGGVALVGVGLTAATAPRPQTATATGPGGAPSLPRVNSPGGSDRRGGGDGPVIINFNVDGHMITDRRTAEWMVQEGREAARRTLDRS